MKAPDILNKAAQHMQNRAAERDQPEGERSMSRTITGHALSERDGWMFMVVLKAARACSTPTGVPDDYEDGPAYFALAGEAAYVAGFPFGQHINRANRPAKSVEIREPSEAEVLAALENKQKTFDELCKNFPPTLVVPKMLDEEILQSRKHRNRAIREIVAMNPQFRVEYR